MQELLTEWKVYIPFLSFAIVFLIKPWFKTFLKSYDDKIGALEKANKEKKEEEDKLTEALNKKIDELKEFCGKGNEESKKAWKELKKEVDQVEDKLKEFDKEVLEKRNKVVQEAHKLLNDVEKRVIKLEVKAGINGHNKS